MTPSKKDKRHCTQCIKTSKTRRCTCPRCKEENRQAAEEALQEQNNDTG